MPLTAIKHRFDPAEYIRDRIGDLPLAICGGRVFCATYIPPGEIKVASPDGEKTVYLPDKTVDESKWQGKAHLVLMLGEEAYRSDSRRDFAAPYCKVGDWIAFTPNSGWMLEWNGVPCRVVEDIDVKMILPAPDSVF